MPCHSSVRLLLSMLLVGLLAATVQAGPSKPDKDDYYELHKVLVDTLDQVERNYVKDVTRRQLIEAAIRGVLSELDPYSAYISPKELKRFQGSVEGEFGGIGIQINIDAGRLKIMSPLAGTPAYRAGLLAGDIITEVDGKSTEGINIDEAVHRLKGKAGTKVTLTVLHPGATEEEKVTITRELIHIETVLGDRHKPDDAWDFMLDHDKRIGYVRITAFSRDTARELRAALAELKKEKLRGLVLDLRFNPGGLLSSAIEVSDLFIPKGRIVSTSGRNSPERTWDAHEKNTFAGFPMVVLVNRYSASASEIVSACLQDNKRAVIMGERTWGKGSVQNVIEMEQGLSALKLTTASYKRPSGKNIDRLSAAKGSDEWGVRPIERNRLKLDEDELLSLFHERRDRDILLPHKKKPDDPKKIANGKPVKDGPKTDKKPEPAKPDETKPDKTKPADRLLRMAVNYLTSELAKAN